MPTQLRDQTLRAADRVSGIRCLLAEAHYALPPVVLAELLLAVRLRLGRARSPEGVPPHTSIAHVRDGSSQAARVYFRPIELLLDAGSALDQDLVCSLEMFVEDIASRPQGAAVPPAA